MQRHQDHHDTAQHLMSSAATDLEATGLRTDATAAAYAQMLCTLAYTAARAGQRTEALAMTEEARRAARHLPQVAPPGQLFAISPAAVDLYALGVHTSSPWREMPGEFGSWPTKPGRSHIPFLAESAVLREALGPELYEAVLAVRRRYWPATPRAPRRSAARTPAGRPRSSDRSA